MYLVRHALLYAVTSVLFGVSAGESLASIIIVQDDRYVMVPGNILHSVPGESDFSVLVTSVEFPIQADQSTFVDWDGFSGAGSAFVNDLLVPMTAQSVVDVTFQVTEPTWFSLGGSTFSYVGGVYYLPAAFSRALIASIGPSPILVDEDRPNGGFFAAGVLEPSVDYRLSISGAEVPLIGSDFVYWNFVFSVPEPSESLLAGFGLLALVSLWRRRFA
jgi:hypothetical protein